MRRPFLARTRIPEKDRAPFSDEQVIDAVLLKRVGDDSGLFRPEDLFRHVPGFARAGRA